MTNNGNHSPGNFLQFSPCIVYVTLYLFLYFYTLSAQNLYNSTTAIIAGLPLFTAFITTAYAFFTFKKSTSIHEKIKIFFDGSINQSSSYFYGSLIGSATFVHILAKIGTLATAICIHLILLPSQWILPFIFCIASMLSIIMRSWLVATIIYMPIACGIAQSLQIDVALMAATIISGILCGYQIVISSTRSNNYELLKKTLWLVIPASLCTLFILSMYQYTTIHPALYEQLLSSLQSQDYLTLLPFFIFSGLAFWHFDLLVNLALCSTIGIITGIFQQKFSFLDATSSIFDGFYTQKSMVKLLILFIFLSGLINIINYNNGFNYIIDKLKYKPKNLYAAQSMIIFIISIINFIFAYDALSIDILTPMIKNLNDRYNLSLDRSTTLLYIISTTVSCFIPYAPIILLSSDLSHVSSIKIIQYMIYPTILYCSAILSIFFFRHKKISTI